MHPIIQKLVDAEKKDQIIPDDIWELFGKTLQQDEGHTIVQYVDHVLKVIAPAALMQNGQVTMAGLYKIMAIGYYIGKGVEAEQKPLDKNEVDQLLADLKIKVKEDKDNGQK